MLQASCVYALNFDGGRLDHLYANINTVFLMHRLQQPASADVDASSYRPLLNLKSGPSASALPDADADTNADADADADSELTPPHSSTAQTAVGARGVRGEEGVRPRPHAPAHVPLYLISEASFVCLLLAVSTRSRPLSFLSLYHVYTVLYLSLYISLNALLYNVRGE